MPVSADKKPNSQNSQDLSRASLGRVMVLEVLVTQLLAHPFNLRYLYNYQENFLLFLLAVSTTRRV